ncbi:hypothetical protein CLU79DRAFT_741522 [Phycomyces nitens]|nr:hypothetical protein CLU79DRAFT_741522 [Phycomyces nitens]
MASIKSACVESYEQRGKETWYAIQIQPDHGPSYTVHRRFKDFLRLSDELCVLYSNGRTTDTTIWKKCQNVVSNSVLKTQSLPVLSPLPRHQSWCTKRSRQRKKQNRLDQYLFQLSIMPQSVWQSQAVHRFLDHQPASGPSPNILDTSHNISSNRSLNTFNPLLPSCIQVCLFLGHTSVTVHMQRHWSLLELRSALDHELALANLSLLPPSSSLAYYHLDQSDRQGALYTLTLNQKKPNVSMKSLADMATSRSFGYFSSPQLQPCADNPSSGIVLLLASDKDLKTAMEGIWHRLDYVTLTCLTW